MLGDPRTTQKTYVLESEWQQFSAQSQDSRIATNTSEIKGVSTQLGYETAHRITGDALLQNQVNATNARVNDVSGRVDKLEQMKVIADVNVRLLDTKKYSVGVFDMFDGRAQRNFAAGVRLTYKLGTSYEERQNIKLKRQLEALQAAVARLQEAQ